MDYALDGPVPWTNPDCRRAGTVHVAGTFAEIRAAEADVVAGRMPERPFVLVAQQSVFDPTRAPAGKHTLWAYAHVPNGWTGDATEAIDRQIERFAPGFRDLVIARHVMPPAVLQRYNPNYVGGDIGGGSHGGLQLVFRPTPRLRPYADAQSLVVPVLGVVTARRRCARHVWPQRGTCGAGRRAAMSGERRRPDYWEVDAGDTVWRFERRFLQSNWTCIWGRGCVGIGPEPAEHLGHGCCSMGAEFDGLDEAAQRRRAGRHAARRWFRAPRAGGHRRRVRR